MEFVELFCSGFHHFVTLHRIQEIKTLVCGAILFCKRSLAHALKHSRLWIAQASLALLSARRSLTDWNIIDRVSSLMWQNQEQWDPSSATGWKPNERLAQGKRSDTLGNRVQRGKPRPVRAKAYNSDRLSYWLTHVISLYITLLPLQGEQEELGCRNPRVPLRSALGYAQIALSGRTRTL